MNATPVSAGRVDVTTALDVALVLRAERLRSAERAIGRVIKRVIKWTALLTVPCAVWCAIAAPNVYGLGCRSMQSEARGNLKALYGAERAFHDEHDRYTSDGRALGFVVKGAHVRHRYFVRVDGAHFRAYAVGERDAMRGDVWTIDDAGELRQDVDACE